MGACKKIITDDIKRHSVKFLFNTDQGPGHVTVLIPIDYDLDELGQYLLDSIATYYKEISITNYEILPTH